MDSAKLVVRPERSLKSRILLSTLCVSMAFLSIYGSYFYGYQKAVSDNKEIFIRADALETYIEQLEKDNESLTFQVAKLQQYKDVQKSAYQKLEKTYETVDQKNEFLNRRVNFYRSIISPEDGISGLRIHNVRLVENDNRGLDFEVTLIQSINHERKMKVKLLLELFDSKSDTKPLTSWSPKSELLVFEYSYVIEGNVKLASGLKDKFVKITATPAGDESKQLVEWHKI